jgi:putative ABC transport system permease protein
MFLTEAVLVYLLSVLLAVTTVAAVMPAFNFLSGLSLDVSYLIRPWFLVLLVILWIGGALVSGLYPGVVLSSFKPIST